MTSKSAVHDITDDTEIADRPWRRVLIDAKQVDKDLQPAAGIVNGCVLSAVIWALVVIAFALAW